MILRKPYAILIKNFRLIHVIMAFLMGYLFYRTNAILNFLNEYLASIATTINSDITISLFNFWYILAIILIILISFVVLALMYFKEKPVKFYLYNIIVYILISIYYYVSHSIIKSLEVGLVDVRTIKLLSDFAVIALIIQALGIIFVIIRATGFDIKSFNFKKDLEELNIESKDNEEFEVEMEFDANKIKRTLNKKIRYFKYAYFENKLIFNVIITLLIIIISIITYLNFGVYNKIYKKGDSFKTNQFIFNIQNIYNTKYDYKNNLIEDGYELIIVDLNLRTLYGERTLNTGNFYLDINGYKYYHTIDYKEKISDIGTNYYKQNIKTDFNSYLLVFKIPDSKVNKKMILKYQDTDHRYIKIKLNPTSLNEKKNLDKTSLANLISFEKSIVKNTSLIINNYEIEHSYSLNYESCLNENCYQLVEYLFPSTKSNYQTDLLKINGNLNLDENTVSVKYNSLFKFINTFGTIKYEINGITKQIKNNLNQIKPKYAKTSDIYIEVPNEVKQADKLYIEFNIRNKIYIYNLK